jgi:hypothetical protein
VADLLAWHQAGQEQGRRPPDWDRVQADNPTEAFDLAGDADNGRQDVERSQPSLSSSMSAPSPSHLDNLCRYHNLCGVWLHPQM